MELFIGELDDKVHIHRRSGQTVVAGCYGTRYGVFVAGFVEEGDEGFEELGERASLQRALRPGSSLL